MSWHQYTVERSLSLTHDIAGLPASTFSPFQTPSQPSTSYNQALHRISKIEFSHPHHPCRTIIYADVYSRADPTRPVYSCPSSPTLSAKSSSTGTSSSASSYAAPLTIGYQLSRSRPNLRRRRTPKMTTLRQLRVKYSEADLKKMYEVQTTAYMNGSLTSSPNTPSVPAFRLLLTYPESQP